MEPDWEQTGIRTIIFFGGGEETDPETRDEVVTKKDVVQLMQSKTKIA